MRKKIAAANWKMNCNLMEATALLKALNEKTFSLTSNQSVIIAVPFPYLLLASEILREKDQFYIAAQNCYTKESGAYTGEVSAQMLASCGISHVIIGHSERRQYFNESYTMLAEKTDAVLKQHLTPVFCCGEALEIREGGSQNTFVEKQISESLFHLNENEISNVIIAYEPIWAIGTGHTASAHQAEEMHAHIRKVIAGNYGEEVANQVSILYGGSVNAGNAQQLFSEPDVDGGLVGGASLKADDFEKIINSLP